MKLHQKPITILSIGWKFGFCIDRENVNEEGEPHQIYIPRELIEKYGLTPEHVGKEYNGIYINKRDSKTNLMGYALQTIFDLEPEDSAWKRGPNMQSGADLHEKLPTLEDLDRHITQLYNSLDTIAELVAQMKNEARKGGRK